MLTQRCSAAGASEVAVLGDGNCFFRAVSLQIFGFEYFHSHVRQMCAAFLVDHRSRASDNQLLEARMKKVEYEKRRRELETEFELDGKKSKAKMKKGEETPTGSDLYVLPKFRSGDKIWCSGEI